MNSLLGSLAALASVILAPIYVIVALVATVMLFINYPTMGIIFFWCMVALRSKMKKRKILREEAVRSEQERLGALLRGRWENEIMPDGLPRNALTSLD